MSPWAPSLEDWFDENDLALCNPPGVATWVGREDQRPSVLDLILLNTRATISDQFSEVNVSFPLSLGSDHAALFLSWSPITELPQLAPTLLPGFIINNDLHDTWVKAFVAIPDPVITSRDSLLIAADRLLDDINEVCRPLFSRRRTPDARGARWWSTTCSAALAIVQSAAPADRRKASKAFAKVLTDEHCTWADNFLHYTTTHQLWEATRWRHGRRATRIPPLRAADGSFTQKPEDAAPLLAGRFFPTSASTISPSHPDDPPPLRERDWPPFSAEEINDALANTSNSSAPGISGINYKLIKWAFSVKPSRFSSLYNGCLEWETHPWVAAKVVPIPKPNKADYSVPKAYRPISLLECCGKLLEKLIACRILHDLNTFDILPNSQFGSRDNYCATDAAISLAHTAQQGIRTGNPVSVLLFDIQGFYDNIQSSRVVHLFLIFGFPSSVVGWMSSFLSHRSATLEFNGWTSDLISLTGGTPQGSPLSPIVSAVYTAPLLCTAKQWPDCSLNLYVDDGGLTASGPTHRSSATKVASWFEYVSRWLLDVGLRTDPEKTEYITFFNPRCAAHLVGRPISHLALRDAANGMISIPRATSVRYLGVFFTFNLSWELHVHTMANCARSTIRALHILGNSIRGLDFANWRKVFHAIVLPVLTYGSPLWATGSRIKSLVNIAQVAQNDALRRISGCFRTTPTEPLHHLLAILPIKLTLDKLNRSFSDRLKRLPPSHALRTITSHNPAACWPEFQSRVPSSLLSLLPMAFPPFTAPTLTSEWSHPLVRSNLGIKPSIAHRQHTRLQIQNHRGLRLIVQLIPSPVGPLGSFMLLHGHSPSAVFSGQHFGTSTAHAIWLALIDGIRSVLSFPPTPLLILIPNHAIAHQLFRLTKHRFLPQASELTSSLSSFLSNAEDDVQVRFEWYSTKWTGLPDRATFGEMSRDPRPDSPPQPPISRRDEAYRIWASQPLPRRSFPARVSITMPNGNKPPPFYMGALSHKSRRISSACLQLTNRHCFDANYSMRFRPTAGDELACPCNFATDTTATLSSRHLDGSAVEGRPMRGRTATEAGSQRNVSFEELQRRYEDPLDDGTDLSASAGYGEDGERPRSSDWGGLLVYHTVKHVLTECPLTATLRTQLLRNMSLSAIFGTEDGGICLGCFLRASQYLLRPLPRPDPP